MTAYSPAYYQKYSITSIHKKGSNDVKNYTPISIIAVFGKTTETVIKNRLIKYFDDSNFITNNQFRYHHKTIVSVIYL